MVLFKVDGEYGYMKKIICVLIMVFWGISLLLCGCNDNSNFSDKFNSELIEVSSVEKMDIAGITYTADEINEMLLKSFNTEMYFFGNNSESEFAFSNSEIFVGEDIEYLVYYRYRERFNTPITTPHSIEMTITNFSYPDIGIINEKLYYHFVFWVNEKGMESLIYSGYYIAESELKKCTTANSDEIVFLGKYRIHVDEIFVPEYDEKDEEWKQNVTLALEKYVESEYCSLPSGKYDVYIRNFVPADYNTQIYFINENGDIYAGFYNFVNEVSSDSPANIHPLNLIPEVSANNEVYQKIMVLSAIHLEVIRP